MEKYTFTIPANGKTDVNAEGNRVYCEAATAPFLLKSGNQTFELKAKRTYVLKQGLKKFLLENRTAAPITVELHIGDDEIIDNEVMITGTISGDVKVVNSDTVGQTTLKTDDLTSQANILLVRTKVDEVRALVNSVFLALTSRVQNRPLKNGRTLLEGNSYAAVNNANTTIVTAAANTNGVIIHHVDLSSEGTSGGAALLINGNIFMRTISGNTAIMGKSQRDIFVPAGWSIAANCGALGYVSMFYEVL